MRFSIEYTGDTEQRLLTYNAEDYSFDVEPSVQEINFDLVLNKLNLTVGDSNRIVQVWGFCGFGEWIKSDYSVPGYRKGILQVTDDLEAGVGSYRVNEEELPVFVNAQSGWVCIGNPEQSGNAVEFIRNCVAVINGDGSFSALWLKPQALPQIYSDG